jgi:hypothetical protein
VSRGAKRVRARLTVTAEFSGGGGGLVCRTRDVSSTGLFLETPVVVEIGTRVGLTLLDEDRGEALQLVGVVARLVPASGTNPAGMGVRLVQAPEGWTLLVDRLGLRARPPSVTGELRLTPRRLRVLVVGEDHRRRGALALYVTSGWDVRFASDMKSAEEALKGIRLDAVIAEHDLSDERWPSILEVARRLQPDARRVIRTSLGGRTPPPPARPGDLVEAVVDEDAGLDAVLEALSA